VKGVITYYRAFENRWQSDFFQSATKDLTISLGTGCVYFDYDPICPPSFRGEGFLAEDLQG